MDPGWNLERHLAARTRQGQAGQLRGRHAQEIAERHGSCAAAGAAGTDVLVLLQTTSSTCLALPAEICVQDV